MGWYFADALKRRQTEIKLSGLEVQIRELANVVSSLKTYSEEIVKSVQKDKSKDIITKVNKELRGKQLQEFGRHRLIRYLKDLGEGKSSEADLFQKFSKAANFDEFVDSLGLEAPADRLHRFKTSSLPRDDFDSLKSKYEMAGE